MKINQTTKRKKSQEFFCHHCQCVIETDNIFISQHYDVHSKTLTTVITCDNFQCYSNYLEATKNENLLETIDELNELEATEILSHLGFGWALEEHPKEAIKRLFDILSYEEIEEAVEEVLK